MKHPGAIKATVYLEKRFAAGMCADCNNKVSKFKRCVECRRRRSAAYQRFKAKQLLQQGDG